MKGDLKWLAEKMDRLKEENRERLKKLVEEEMDRLKAELQQQTEEEITYECKQHANSRNNKRISRNYMQRKRS